MTFIKIICDMKNWIFAALLLTLLACRGNAPKNDEQPAADASDESEMALEEQGHGKAFDEGDAEWEEYQRQAPDDEEFTLTPQRHKRTIEDYVTDFAVAQYHDLVGYLHEHIKVLTDKQYRNAFLFLFVYKIVYLVGTVDIKSSYGIRGKKHFGV